MTISNAFIDETLSGEGVQELVSARDWMKSKRLELINTLDGLDKFIEEAIEVGECAVDLETNGLNTGPKRPGTEVAKIAGFCLAYNENYGVYVPVNHSEGRNLPMNTVVDRIKKLLSSTKSIYHNFKFDGELLRYYGMPLEDPDKYEDTLLMACVLMSDRKNKGLKGLSKDILHQEMIELKELFSSKSNMDFTCLNPKQAVFYAASDAICTFGLYKRMHKMMMDMDPKNNNGTRFIYNAEKGCQLVVMEMERNLLKVDMKYFGSLARKAEDRLEELETEIYETAGEPFNIGSNPQLGKLLFDKFKLPYPIKEKSKTGDYFVTDDILKTLKDKHPLPRLIQEYRSTEKVYQTYLYNFIKNADENQEIKINLNQTGTDSGRFSSRGGAGLKEDGYSGVNCQNIPAYNPNDPWKIRKGILARPGYKIVAIDYAGEELRIATNFSKEKVWADEFNNGTGDLHSITAATLFGGKPVDYTTKEKKGLRGIAKAVNFLILYGGGASKLAQSADIPIQDATEKLDRFFDSLPDLKSWMSVERIRARKRGYTLTAFGRRRPLKELYDSGDRGLIAKADRLALNSAIQGCIISEERVLTSLGYMKVKDLYESDVSGETVWTGTSWAPFKVLDKGEWDYANLNFKDGSQHKCDTRHKVLVETETDYLFKHYSELKPGDKVCTSVEEEMVFGEYEDTKLFDTHTCTYNAKSVEISTSEDWDNLAFIAGVILGDGTLRDSEKNKDVTLSFGREKIENLLPRISALLEGWGLKTGKVRRMSGSKGESYQSNINSKNFVEALKYIGLTPATSHTKRVPDYMFKAPLNMRKAYLRGYWEADGAKKRRNRYSFHTPNQELLRDVQALGRTLGLRSRICSTNVNTFRLDWSDLDSFEDLVGIERTTKRKISQYDKTTLPLFKNQEFYDLLKDVIPTSHTNERALLSKLKTGKPVVVDTVVRLCKNYGVELPRVYKTVELVSKEETGEKGPTYTLSVDDNSHRFEAGGIINKNTGADIIKIAMYRVWKYIRQNGLQNDVKMLMPIHDEIVYEIREDKLDEIIPAIAGVMQIKDLSTALKWSVGLEVDAEYGDDFTVQSDFFTDQSKGISAAMRLNMTPEELEAALEAAGDSPEEIMEELQNKLPDVIEEEDEQDEQDLGESKSSEFFNYEVQNTDELAKAHVEVIWCVLSKVGQYMEGPKKRIRLTKDSKVIYTTRKEYNVDGFLALAFNYNV